MYSCDRLDMSGLFAGTRTRAFSVTCPARIRASPPCCYRVTCYIQGKHSTPTSFIYKGSCSSDFVEAPRPQEHLLLNATGFWHLKHSRSLEKFAVLRYFCNKLSALYTRRS